MNQPLDLEDDQAPWWALQMSATLNALDCTADGLSTAEAERRRRQYGANALQARTGPRVLPLLWRQLSSPIVLILIGAALLSFFLRAPTDGTIILIIVLATGLLGLWQEYHAAAAVESLLRLVAVQAQVLRDGQAIRLPVEDIVPGDVLLLSAGSSVPADCRLIDARDLSVNEATLTGESFPVDKQPGERAADTPMAQRSHVVFQGTHVVSGTARALVVRTGQRTEFGQIAERLRVGPAETDFERGVRGFGLMLLRMTLLLMLLIFAFNVYLARPVLDSFLFALALAVGLTPELLPAIISVNLASGARRMATRKVIVKRLVAIENFGSMDVLCSDKTGTLTEGHVQLAGALDPLGVAQARVLQLAAVNAGLQTGFANPIDRAVLAAAPLPEIGATRLDELSYDFTRKRLSVLAQLDGQPWLVTKGALAQVLEVCSEVELADGRRQPLSTQREALQRQFAEFSTRGLRTLGLAVKALPGRTTVAHADETGMCFVGFLLFEDPPKAGIADTLHHLHGMGVRLKLITGDNPLVAQEVARRIGLDAGKIVTGEQLNRVSDDALRQLTRQASIFAEVEPNQKERIVRALRQAGHVVGYIGDGINDAPALHAADVGISVQEAADVAKDAADIVLLEHDLAVLAAGIHEGRVTFANTLKYVFMATSANFGNMISMAGASLVLPFLPLLPKQILLTNLLTDLPEMAIAGDRVDPRAIGHPRRWDVRLIHRFMMQFGLLSSIFDFLTFGVLFGLLHASPMLLRSGWFVESVVSACLVVLVIRTRAPFWQSRPSPALAAATAGVVAAAMALPFTPIGALFGLGPLPGMFLMWMSAIVLTYLAAAEALKRRFYRHHHPATARQP